MAWLAVQQTGVPIAQLVDGKQLEKVSQLEMRLIDDPREREVREILRKRAADADARLRDLNAFSEGKAALEKRR